MQTDGLVYDLKGGVPTRALLRLAEPVMLGLAVIVLSSPAEAQSESFGTDSFPAKSFQGFYGQISTGYENDSVTPGNITNSGLGTFIASGNSSKTSMPLIGGIGYTAAVSERFTLGLGADYAPFTVRTNSVTATAPTTTGGANYQTNNRFSVVLIPGYVLDADKLVYLKVGYTGETLQSTLTTSNQSLGSTTMSGYALGLGYKQLFDGHLYAFGESNYLGYGKGSLSTQNSAGNTIASSPSERTYNFLVGVGYQF